MTRAARPAGGPTPRPAGPVACAVHTHATRTADGAVSTQQRVRVSRPIVDASVDGARSLARAYWGEVERTTRGLVHVDERPASLHLRLGARGPSLLRFGPPELEVDQQVVRCRYAIAGGLLTRRPSGALALEQVTLDHVELRSSVTGFFPRLGAPPGRPGWTGALYTRAQARLHDAIGRRFLARLAEEAA